MRKLIIMILLLGTVPAHAQWNYILPGGVLIPDGVTIQNGCDITGDVEAGRFVTNASGSGTEIPPAILAAACFGLSNGFGFSFGGGVECLGGVPDLFVTDGRRDTCVEVRAALGATERTGTCGKVVFSQAPTLTGLVQSEAGHDGPTVSPTPSASPTGVTPTATAATPTPTATRSPVRAIDGDLDVNGQVHVTGTSAFDAAVTIRKDTANAQFLNTISNQNGGNLATAGIRFSSNGVDGYILAYPASSISGAPFSDSWVFLADTSASAGIVNYVTANAPIYWYTNGLPRYKITGNGHLVSTGPDPTLAGCGSGATIVGDDGAGRIVAGTGVITTCTVTFAGSYVTAPSCILENETTLALIGATPTTTTFAFTVVASQTYSYQCKAWE